MRVVRLLLSRSYTKMTSSCEARSRSKLTGDDRTAKLSVLLDSGWKEVEGRDAIFKEFVFKNFNQRPKNVSEFCTSHCYQFPWNFLADETAGLFGAFSVMTRVAMLAEKIDHHPEWFNVYNKLQVTLSTHDVGGVSDNDVKMAKFIDSAAKAFE